MILRKRLKVYHVEVRTAQHSHVYTLTHKRLFKLFKKLKFTPSEATHIRLNTMIIGGSSGFSLPVTVSSGGAITFTRLPNWYIIVSDDKDLEDSII